MHSWSLKTLLSPEANLLHNSGSRKMTQLADSGDFGVEEMTNHAWKHRDRSLHVLKQGGITEQKLKSQQETYWRVCSTTKSTTVTKQVPALLHLAWRQGCISSPNEILKSKEILNYLKAQMSWKYKAWLEDVQILFETKILLSKVTLGSWYLCCTILYHLVLYHIKLQVG